MELSKLIKKPSSKIIREIIYYLNKKSKKNFRHQINKTNRLIQTRFNEGFVFEDFKKVIDNKVIEWLDTDYDKYLRPETLFGAKFESYLNQKNEIEMIQNIIFPDEWSKEYEQKLNPVQLIKFQNHLKKIGLIPIKRNGQVIKWKDKNQVYSG